MIILSNSGSLDLGPGQSVTFNIVILHTGCAEQHRPGTGAVTLRAPNAIYAVEFGANIGASAPGVAQLGMLVNGDPLPEMTMISTTAAAGDLNTVSKKTHLATRDCCPNMMPVPKTITIVNTGETNVIVENPLLDIKRDA